MIKLRVNAHHQTLIFKNANYDTYFKSVCAYTFVIVIEKWSWKKLHYVTF